MRIHPHEPRTAIITDPSSHASVQEWVDANDLTRDGEGGILFDDPGHKYDRVLFESEYEKERDECAQ